MEQGWWHSSLTLKCMHLLLKEVNKRGRHAYNLHRWTCLPSGIVMEIHLVLGSCSSKILLKGVYTGGVLSRLVANFCFSLSLLFAVMFWIHSRLPHNWNFWGCCEAEAAILLFSVICSWFSKVLLLVFVSKINSQTFNATWLIYVPPKVNL